MLGGGKGRQCHWTWNNRFFTLRNKLQEHWKHELFLVPAANDSGIPQGEWTTFRSYSPNILGGSNWGSHCFVATGWEMSSHCDSWAGGTWGYAEGRHICLVFTASVLPCFSKMRLKWFPEDFLLCLGISNTQGNSRDGTSGHTQSVFWSTAMKNTDSFTRCLVLLFNAILNCVLGYIFLTPQNCLYLGGSQWNQPSSS